MLVSHNSWAGEQGTEMCISQENITYRAYKYAF